VVDYTLAKRSILRQARRGLLTIHDICDAHPELLRAARHVGEKVSRPCPVCDRSDLHLLAYVYADQLKRDNGRVWAIDKALALTASVKGGTCYVVEVCTGCSWNHLTEAFVERSAG
jgi:cytosine/adenosine deaminase-related metal-dependent hydrolase